ncbi:MAG TPA: pilus assembly PilX N-terminal domain-containing protein [Candidatus Dormibacteraeota bacterium]|nr:pilus assembly PilX N-terminal domain-containing protein [Candidatus Dormibacteraeota bacterium]
MKNPSAHQRKTSQAGVALLIAIFVLLLISVVALSLIIASGTESSLAGNYRSSAVVYYAASAGLEEGRGRLLPNNPNYFNLTSPSFIPPALGPSEVRYIKNPEGSEDVLTAYPDTEYEKEFGPGSLAAANRKFITSVSSVAGLSGPSYKWVRINPITEASINLDINNDGAKNSTSPLYFDGAHLTFAPTGKQALELTSLAVLSNDTQKLLQYVVAPIQLDLQSFPAAVTAIGAITETTKFGGEDKAGEPAAKAFGISGDDRCNKLAQKYAVSAADPASAKNLQAKLTPASNFPGTAGTTTAPSVVDAAGTLQNFRDPLVPGQRLDLTTIIGLNQLVAEIKSVADSIASDCTKIPVGSATNPVVTVVTGNCNLSGTPTTPGQGILLVEGDMQYSGHPYDGLILVIGTGRFYNPQSSDLTQFYGSIFLAQTKDPGTLAALAAPGAPTLDWQGAGGNPNIQFDSCILSTSNPINSFRVLSFKELSR